MFKRPNWIKEDYIAHLEMTSPEIPPEVL